MTRTPLALSLALALPLSASAETLQGLRAFAQQPSDPAAALSRLFDANASAGTVSAQSLPSGRGLSPKDLQKSMLQNLDFIQSAFSAQYGPGQWKESHEGWDLDKRIAEAKAQVLATPGMTIDQYHDVLRRFFGSMKDFHVSVQFNATAASTLPFSVVGANGRYFIEYIDRSKLPETTFPFHVGDELVAFGGKKTSDVVADLVKREGGNTAQTEAALAALFLTSRRAASFGDVQSGPVSVTVKPKGSDKPLTRQLLWDYTPELISGPTTGKQSWTLRAQEDAAKKPFPFPTEMLSPVAGAVGTPTAANPFGLGGRDSFLPALGKKTWASADDDIFSAYEFELPDGRKIGYVRIASYEVDDANAAVAEFAGLMKKFQAETDALVIDQVNNPGGSVFYMYALASMLTDQPLTTPQHHVAITQDDVSSALDFLKTEPLVKNDALAKKVLGESQEGYPVDYMFYRHMVEYSRFIVSQWNAGKTLTDPTFLDGVDMINPSPVAQFTKPVVLLINELDFSGGDFFPATLQDNKRATLFGTRTAGAGGFVRSVKYPNNVGVAGFSMTGSIAVRADHQPIENLGVRADVQYAPTAADLQNGFADYAKSVDAELVNILGAAPAK
ncbi:MAG TPA: protease-like activity factor CPAF [Elusimicrobiota bacterium]|nr:protease-like activity factor CPAF [Elusimicrobiota bacterium]